MVFESGGFISGAVAPVPVMQLADREIRVDIHVVYKLLPGNLNRNLRKLI